MPAIAEVIPPKIFLQSSYAMALFSDAHNASYYINSYTTKVNPTMDDVLRNLLDGVRRLQGELQDREAKLAEGAASTADGHAAKRREDFRRTMQVLSRFESCFRRASWKSGSEMVFPMLFGHLAVMTHRCWDLFMRKAIYLAAAAPLVARRAPASLGARLRREQKRERCAPGEASGRARAGLLPGSKCQAGGVSVVAWARRGGPKFVRRRMVAVD